MRHLSEVEDVVRTRVREFVLYATQDKRLTEVVWREVSRAISDELPNGDKTDADWKCWCCAKAREELGKRIETEHQLKSAGVITDEMVKQVQDQCTTQEWRLLELRQRDGMPFSTIAEDFWAEISLDEGPGGKSPEAIDRIYEELKAKLVKKIQECPELRILTAR